MPTRLPPPRPALLAAALAACVPCAARAQQPVPADSAAPAPIVADTAGCPRIGSIFVDNNSVFVPGDPGQDRRFAGAYRLANRLHVRTRESVIRRELLFREGDCYRPFLLEDSERILRSTGYLADADVFSVRQPNGTYDVIVETRDEWSTRIEASAGSGEVSGVELREDNLLGRGMRVAAFMRQQQGERVYGGRVGTPQLFGTHLDAEVSLARTPIGISASERIILPFRGEMARWAFREAIVRDERNFQYFVAPLVADSGLERRLFPVERTSWDIGMVRRFGQRGRLSLLGIALAGERWAFPQDTLGTAADEDGPAQELPGGGVVPGLAPVSATRLVLLAGQRRVTFDRRRGLDAVHGAEDVQLGAELDVAVGRTIGAFSTDDDLSLDFGINAATELPGGMLAGMRLVLETKRDYRSPVEGQDWRDTFGQLDVWSYWHPTDESRHTVVFAARASGGWHAAVPFQLTLGHRAGLRGYPRQVFAGQRRVVVTLEHRAFLAWPFPRLFDLGSAVFLDAGKTWAGDDPFGRNSTVLLAGGAGVRFAFPPGSRRTFRLDLAFPLAPEFRPSGLQISIGTGQAVGRTAVDPDPQIQRSSRRPVGSSLFDYP
ncbi:MAG TPA: POTRA domain-containing protein [Longimicrobium sp.]|nr:POTRA domain-containing protein [Longimicrobium sp.]